MTQTGINTATSHPAAHDKTGAVRLVTLRLSAAQKERAEQSKSFSRYLTNFLDKEIKSPFRYKQLSTTAFAINGKCDPLAFDEYVIDLHARLIGFLFGSEVSPTDSVLVFAGTDIEVAEFISEPEAKAIERSRNYLKRVLEERAKIASADKARELPEQLPESKRPLLFRGILVCPKEVLLAYAVTPDKDLSVNPAQKNREDIDLENYLRSMDAEAIEFTVRLFEKASFLLQTASKEYQNSILVVPLSYKSLLSSHARQRFFAVMRDHPEWVRNHMILSVVCSPERPSSSMVQRFSGEFCRYFRTTDWQITLPDFDLSVFQGCNLQSITFDTHGYRHNRDKALESYFLQVPLLKKNKIRPAISGLETAEELRACCEAGVIYASGNAITAPLVNFGPAQKIDLQDLPLQELTAGI